MEQLPVRYFQPEVIELVDRLVLFGHRRYRAVSEKIRSGLRTFGKAQTQDARHLVDTTKARSSNAGAILAEAGNPANEQKAKWTMPDKTKTIVVIESHEQTVIHRSRRLISSQLFTQSEATTSSDAPKPSVLEKPKGRWWQLVAVRGVNAFSNWSRQLKRSGSENKQP